MGESNINHIDFDRNTDNALLPTGTLTNLSTHLPVLIIYE